MQVSREERVFPGGGNGRCNGSGASVCMGSLRKTQEGHDGWSRETEGKTRT